MSVIYIGSAYCIVVRVYFFIFLSFYLKTEKKKFYVNRNVTQHEVYPLSQDVSDTLHRFSAYSNRRKIYRPHPRLQL